MQMTTILVHIGDGEEIGFTAVSDIMNETQMRNMSRSLSLFLLGDQGRSWHERDCCGLDIPFDALELVNGVGVSNLYSTVVGDKKVYIWFDGGLSKYSP